MKHGVDIFSNISSLINSVKDHALGNRNHLGQRFMQDADKSPLVAMVCAPINDEGEEFIRQLFFVVKEIK
jgi:hypothetical protein